MTCFIQCLDQLELRINTKLRQSQSWGKGLIVGIKSGTGLKGSYSKAITPLEKHSV